VRGTEHGGTDSDGDKREEREGGIRNGNPVSPSGARTAGGRRGTGSQAVLGSCRVGGRVELVMWQLRKGTAAVDGDRPSLRPAVDAACAVLPRTPTSVPFSCSALHDTILSMFV